MSESKTVNSTVMHELDNINGEIENLTCALSLIPDGYSDVPMLRVHLGKLHERRFTLLGKSEDIDKAIDYISEITLGTNENQCKPDGLAYLGALHGKRFQRLNKVDDSDKAIEYMSLALALTPETHPDISRMLANLGAFYDDRFQRLDRLGDLGKAIEYHSRAVQLTPDGHPDLCTRLANLGVSFKNRFYRQGELGDLESAIEYETLALALASDGHSYLPTLLSNLGASHSDRFQRLGELKDVEKGIEYGSRGISLAHDSHPHLPYLFTNLGAAHGYRFQRVGKIDDLDKAIDYHSRALFLTPDDHPSISRRLANIGACHTTRFERLGELGDLEQAIKYESRGLLYAPDDHPDLPYRHTNLGASHTHRFKLLGELSDLEKAIEHQSWALAAAAPLTPDGHPALSRRPDNQGVSHIHRFRLLGQLSDLEKAIDHGTRALALTPNDHPDFPRRHTNLGVSHYLRFQRSGDPNNLKEAIQFNSQALGLTPYDHPARLKRLANQGLFYSSEYALSGSRNDLESATKYLSCAIELTPEGHPDFPDRHSSLAMCRFYQYRHTGDRSDLENALYSFRMATHLSAGSPRDKFKCAVKWANLAAEDGSLNPIEAYRTTINLLPQFIWIGSTTIQRYLDLLSLRGLAVNAAFAAILSSDYALALEWLEHTRCVVWNQTLVLRSPIDQLYSVNPDLATRLQAIAKQLDSASSETREFQGSYSDSLGMEQVAQEHRRLAAEYNTLLTQARNLSGLEDFLRPAQANVLIQAARYGPVVVINCYQNRCDALLIVPGQKRINHVPLPDYTAEKAQRACSELGRTLRSKRLRERGVKIRIEPGQKDSFGSLLAELWNYVVRPILVSLGLTNSVSEKPLPHITWCPTGALSFLPLHAAGDYERPHARVFDYVVSSYTPTLAALSSASPSSLRPDSRFLGIGLALTPGHNPLPGTVGEIACVKRHAQNAAGYSQLVNNEATRAAVLDAMEQHDWVHLACHAHQNVDDPTKSGFFLHDGTLDLATINRRSLKNKGLAFLSACQTATGDERLPDEVVHLASGMLLAGYSSVIATMWSVIDEDAPFVANNLYYQLLKDGTIGSGEAGKALHYAVAELRQKVGEREFGRWVPYIHIGS